MNTNTDYAIAQAADGSTSINSAATKNIDFNIAGQQKAVILADGSMGLGTSPSAGLHVKTSGDTVKVEGTGNTSSIVHVSGGDTVGTASSGFLNDSGVQQKSYTIENKKDSDNQNNHILIKSSNVDYVKYR